MAIIGVLDDDVQSLQHTCALIEQEGPEDPSRRICPASSIDELLKVVLSTKHIDILVCDVMMPEGQPSGIDVVQGLFPPSSGTQIIYMSGYLAQATEVYRTDHVYFLLKPLDPVKVRDALQRAYAAIKPAGPRMLRVMSGHKERLINVAAIRYVESNLHKVSVHCGDVTFTTYAKIDDIQARLPKTFSRCHRSYLINLAHVVSLDETEVRLRDGATIPVSRRRARQLQRDLLAYLSRG